MKFRSLLHVPAIAALAYLPVAQSNTRHEINGCQPEVCATVVQRDNQICKLEHELLWQEMRKCLRIRNARARSACLLVLAFIYGGPSDPICRPRCSDEDGREGRCSKD